MENTSRTRPIADRELYYHRERLKQNVFSNVVELFAAEAEKSNITKKDLATMLGKDPAQVTRWLMSPSNFTLDSLSDILLALGAELETRAVKFAEKPMANEMHPLIEEILGQSTQRSTTVTDSTGSTTVRTYRVGQLGGLAPPLSDQKNTKTHVGGSIQKSLYEDLTEQPLLQEFLLRGQRQQSEQSTATPHAQMAIDARNLPQIGQGRRSVLNHIDQ